MASKWTKLAAVVLVVVTGIAVAALLIRARSGLPGYQGRSLAGWLNDCEKDEPNPEARVAVITILTNNLPWAVRSLDYDPKPKRARDVAIYSKMPQAARRSPLLMEMLTRDRDSMKLVMAANAFEVAGPEAKAAVPELTRLMLNTNREFASLHALRALSYIGAAAQGPLEMVLTNASYPFRVKAVRLLAPAGPSGCTHLLRLVMNDPDSALRTAATNTLVSRGFNPDEVFRSSD